MLSPKGISEAEDPCHQCAPCHDGRATAAGRKAVANNRPDPVKTPMLFLVIVLFVPSSVIVEYLQFYTESQQKASIIQTEHFPHIPTHSTPPTPSPSLIQ